MLVLEEICVQNVSTIQRMEIQIVIQSNSNSKTEKNFKLCEKCKLNITPLDKRFCNYCFSKEGKNNSKKEKKVEMNDEKADFTITRVKFLKTDNSSSNPLLWDDEKLKEEKRCFYCSKFLKEHESSKPCKEKFSNYFSREVRHLLFKNISPPVRNSRPIGEAKHP